MITTTKYLLKIPEATDPADLRVFVGDNMTILDGHTHTWNDITGKPSTFVPPLMQGGAVGGARVGNGLGMSGEYLFVKIQNGISLDTTANAIQIDRTYMDNLYQLKGTTSYILPKASPTVLGGIMVGTNLTIDANGVLSSTQVTWDTLTLKPTTFPPPLMQVGQVGGARVGNGLSMSGEYLYVKTGTGIKLDTTNYSIMIDRTIVDTYYALKIHTHDWADITTGMPTTFTPPIATTGALGGIIVGDGLAVDINGVVSVTGGGGTTYTLPPSTTTALGGVIVGAGLNVDATGLLTVGALNYLPLTGGTITGATQINNQLNINAINNSLVQTQPITNTIWYGIMKDASTYSFAMGRFSANSDNIDLRAYFGNLTIMTGRSTGATTADITIQTNQSNATGVTSQNIHIMPNQTVGTFGYTKVWSNLNVTGQITQNGGLNVIQQSPVTGTGTILNVWTGTQAQYDVLTKDPSTVYYIVG
jgi:hypothetical protein